MAARLAGTGTFSRVYVRGPVAEKELRSPANIGQKQKEAESRELLRKQQQQQQQEVEKNRQQKVHTQKARVGVEPATTVLVRKPSLRFESTSESQVRDLGTVLRNARRLF